MPWLRYIKGLEVVHPVLPTRVKWRPSRPTHRLCIGHAAEEVCFGRASELATLGDVGDQQCYGRRGQVRVSHRRCAAYEPADAA